MGQLGVHDGPQKAVALQAEVPGLRVRLAVAEEGAELQLQVHARDLAVGRLPLDRRAAHAGRNLRVFPQTQPLRIVPAVRCTGASSYEGVLRLMGALLTEVGPMSVFVLETQPLKVCVCLSWTTCNRIWLLGSKLTGTEHTTWQLFQRM